MNDEWKLPELEIDIAKDESHEREGFLRLRRLVLQNRYPDGESSREYRYDVVERDALDAVAIVLVAHVDGELRVCVRSATRPPLLLRREARLPLPADDATALWEVPAGLVEPGEEGEAGLRACAARETLEETGLTVSPDAFAPLGQPVFLSPGLMAEQVHFLWAEVDPSTAEAPTEDGSPVEERARSIFITLAEAFAAVGSGLLRDAKTEIALHRLVAQAVAGE